MLTALYTRVATTALSSPRIGAPVTLRRAQSPCALCRGDRARFVGKEPREAGGLAEPFFLILGGISWCPLEERSLADGKNPPRGSPGLESLVPSRGEVPREGKNPRAAHQAWRAWCLAKSSEECLGTWQAGPWYPGFHCADSSPRARDGHAEIRRCRRSVEGPMVPAWATTRGARRLRPRPRPPRLQLATWWGPPRPRHLGVKACAR